MNKKILILSVFVVASCGLAYELIAGAMSSYLLGDSILQFSTIIGCYLFAMGVGAHFSKYVRDDDVLSRFVDIELAVGLIGGLSAAILFMTFSWMAAPFRTLLYVMVFLIGALVGMEVPLVMRALNSRQTEFLNWSAACSPSITWARWPSRCCSRWCCHRTWDWYARAFCSACLMLAWACGQSMCFARS